MGKRNIPTTFNHDISNVGNLKSWKNKNENRFGIKGAGEKP